MKRVTQKEFYDVIGPLDAVLTIVGNRTDFKIRHTGRLVGWSLDTGPLTEDVEYYLQ